MQRSILSLPYARALSRLFSSFALAALLAQAGSTAAVAAANPPAELKTRNVIYLIGDGMGLSHVSGAVAVSGQPLALEQAEVIGLAKTSSANAYVTDSAASGTALAAGVKTRNGVIGQDAEGNAVPSVLAYAAAAGKSTGVVVTSTVTHATPAAFIGHNESRKNEPALAEDYLVARPDVVIGGGRRFFEKREDGRNLSDDLRSGGYTVAYTLEEVLATPTGTRLFGLLADGAMPRASEGRGAMLPQSVGKALEILGTNPEGFVLMVEGSQIDWGGHGNDWQFALTELQDFDAAVKVAVEYAERHPGTLVIVTADHETGGLSLTGGNLQERTVTTAWGTKGHSATMVPVYAYGAGAQLFNGVYENTEIFHRILNVLGLDKAAAPKVENRAAAK